MNVNPPPPSNRAIKAKVNEDNSEIQTQQQQKSAKSDTHTHTNNGFRIICDSYFGHLLRTLVLRFIFQGLYGMIGITLARSILSQFSSFI